MNCCDCNNNCYCKLCETYSYAQYGVQSNPPSNSDLPMFTLFQEGNQINLNNTEIVLKSGYLYLINYIFLGTTEINSYIQITPKINNAPNLLYSFFAPSGTTFRNTSVSGSFTLQVLDEDTTLAFYLTYPDTVRNIDISGTVSVTALNKIKNNKCK